MLQRTADREFVTRKSPEVAGFFLKLPTDPPSALEDPSIIVENAKLEMVNSFVPELVPKSHLSPGDTKKEKLIDTSQLDMRTTDALVEAGYMPNGEEIPEIFPVFTGIRARILEMRVSMIQRKVERLAKRQRQIHFIGKRVLEDKSYTSTNPEEIPDDIERAHTMGIKISANRLSRLRARHVNVAQRRHTLERVYPEAIGNQPSYIPFMGISDYDKGPKNNIQRSLGERRSLNRGAKLYNHSGIAQSIYKDMFTRIVTKPGRAAEGLPEKRDRLAVKAEAMKKAVELRGVRRAERREAIADKFEIVASMVEVTKRAMVRATKRGVDLVGSSAYKGVLKTVELVGKSKEFTAKRVVEIGAFATALSAEMPDIIETHVAMRTADKDYEQYTKKDMPKRAGHEVLLTTEAARQTAKATKKSWKSRKI